MATSKNKGKKDIEYWREKALKRRLRCKELSIKVRRLEQSRDKWLQRCKSGTAAQDYRTRISRHRYPAEVMLLGLVMHIIHNVSLRAVSGALKCLGELKGMDFSRLSATTIRNWSMRFGLYSLSCRRTGGNYALIIDESVSIGQEKVLLVLGVPLSGGHSRTAPLNVQDVEVLHVGSKTGWKGSEVSSVIEKWRSNSGASVAYAISDGAHNLKNGVGLSGIPWVYDCTHVISNQIKRMFAKDERLNTLVKHINATRTLWPCSQWAAYMPPSMRKKARSHQVLAIHVWAGRMLDNYELLPAPVQSQLAYLKEYKDLICTLKTLSLLVEAFCGTFKAKGINRHTIASWQGKADAICPNSTAHAPPITAFKNAMDEYLRQTYRSLSQHDQILCCSDVLESMFGKYKNKAGAQMISADILKIAAFPKKMNIDQVRQAMISISNSDVDEWAKSNTVPSLLVLKRKVARMFLVA
jgi:hypothetical protein